MVKVETFEQNEISDIGLLEINDQQKELIDSLGLDGQKTLIGQSENKTLIAYPEVTSEQDFIIKSICPKRHDVKSYKRTPIPLRIMQIIAHVMQENYFTKVYIFDKEDVAIKDPFIVGCKGEYYNGIYYLLGRWGEELESWSKLKEIALKVFFERKKIFVAKQKRDLDDYLLDDNINATFQHQTFEIPTLRGWN